MKWISVKESLPDDNQEVFVFCKLDHHESMAFDVLYKNKNFWEYYGPVYKMELENITHWMPIPCPPSESQCKSKCLRCKN